MFEPSREGSSVNCFCELPADPGIDESAREDSSGLARCQTRRETAFVRLEDVAGAANP
jgi:hypothetical protein